MKKNIFIIVLLFPAVLGLAGPVDVVKAKELARKYIGCPVRCSEQQMLKPPIKLLI